MTGYEIQPDGVRSALLATSSSAHEVSTALQPAAGASDSVATGCAGSKVSSALNVLLGAEYARATAMGERIEACVSGAVAATNAYVRHDEDMGHDIRHIQAAVVAKTRKLAQ